MSPPTGSFWKAVANRRVQRRLDPSERDKSVPPATAENPLLLSGLAFAGANRRGAAKPDESDGILTAEEIAGINLEGVDWAVLSACDTGVGEIKSERESSGCGGRSKSPEQRR